MADETEIVVNGKRIASGWVATAIVITVAALFWLSGYAVGILAGIGMH